MVDGGQERISRMEAEVMTAQSGGLFSKFRDRGYGWLVLGILLVCLMPSTQSIWIDEAFSIAYTEPDSFDDLRAHFLVDRGAEPLMPLGMLSFWAGSKVVGRSEFGLRSISALWAAVAVFLAWRAGSLIGMPWFGAFFACHPFLWLYGGEIRPYSLTIAMGTGLLYAFAAIVSGQQHARTGVRALLLFGPLLCASNAIAVVPFGVVIVVSAPILIKKGWKPNRVDGICLALSGIVLAALAAYYAVTLARGMDYGWTSSWKIGFSSLAFSLYEFLGFSGFGPGRNEMRELALSGGIRALLAGMVQFRAVGGLLLIFLYGTAFFAFVRNARARRFPEMVRLISLALGVAMSTTLAVYVLSIVQTFPFWGRHLAGIFPFFVLILFLLSLNPTNVRESRPALLTILIGLTLLCSSLFLRFHDDHRKDDYRSAARIARSALAEGRVVWWSAGPNCAAYYSVPLCGEGPTPSRQCAYFLDNHVAGAVTTLPEPDLILLSKPDVYDRARSVQDFIEANSYSKTEELMAFRIYEAPANQNP